MMLADKVQGGLPVSRLGHDGDVGLGVQQGPEPGAHQRLIIGEQDPDHVVSLDNGSAT
jgi:hypothetical protein